MLLFSRFDIVQKLTSVIKQLLLFYSHLMEENRSPLKSKQSSGKKYLFEAKEFQQKVTLLCRFCGGNSCPQEDFRTNKKQPNAIQGLHSNWITDNILAMQRPSQKLIKHHKLYEAWKRQNITTILNLQEPGQHPYCGDGIIGNHGFSYIPEHLYKHNLHFFNPSWEDMTATTCDFMMKIMDVFDHTFQRGGKIAVHCHAGRGRTLMAICGWLIYSGYCTAKQSIQLAVLRREGVLTKNSQRQFLYQFQQFLKTKRRCFGLIIKMPFDTLIQRHQQTILKRHRSNCKSIPYLFHIIIEQIFFRLSNKSSSIKQIIICLQGKKWNQQDQNQLKQFKNQCNQIKTELASLKNQPISILIEALFDYFDEMPFNPVDMHSCEHMQNHQKEGKHLVDILTDPEVIHSVGSYVLCTILAFIKFLTSIKSLQASNEDLDFIINRIVKCLLSKRKFNRLSYNNNRFMKAQITLTKHQKFIKQLIINGIQQDFSPQKFENLQVKIRRKNADLYFHKSSLKESREKQYFQAHEVQEQIYKKIK